MDTAYHPEQIHPSAYVAPNATLVGDVTVGAEASIWFGAVLRGDVAPIVVGSRTNVQDGCTLHVDAGLPCTLGEGVTVGHGAVIHGATIEDGVLVGIGAVVLNGAVIGRQSLVGAGTVVPEGMVVPPRSLVLGVPARVVRSLTEEELGRLRGDAERYVERVYTYRAAAQGGQDAGSGTIEQERAFRRAVGAADPAGGGPLPPVDVQPRRGYHPRR